MFTEICFCTLYNLLLGCTTYKEYCYMYLLYIIYYFTVSPSPLTFTYDKIFTPLF